MLNAALDTSEHTLPIERVPDSASSHTTFFSQGEEGNYPGGPSERPAAAPVADNDELEFEPISGLIRSPEQERRRVVMARAVAAVLGVALAVVLLSTYLSFRNRPGPDEEQLAGESTVTKVQKPPGIGSAAVPKTTNLALPPATEGEKPGDLSPLVPVAPARSVSGSSFSPGGSAARVAAGIRGSDAASQGTQLGGGHQPVTPLAPTGPGEGGTPRPPSASPVATGRPATASFPVE